MVMAAKALAWVAMLVIAAPAVAQTRPTEGDYYRLVDVVTSRTRSASRDPNWRPGGREVVLEVSGLEVLDEDRVAVATRMGEVWVLSGAYGEPPKNLKFTRFASALHEPMGLLREGDSLLAMQRTELTRLRDTDGDGVADEYLTVAKGWNVSGNYHEYAFGPKRDGAGNLWITLNIGMGAGSENDKPWRGWALVVTPEGQLKPVCAGLRSPSGLGANAEGDMFVTDQQGNWVPAGSLHHLRRGVFLGNPEMIKTFDAKGSTVKLSGPIPKDRPYPEALAALPELKPPAVWFPYHKMGESATDIAVDASGGKFGPFSGQLFVGDFTSALINRVFLERVNGEYQGACFPFREGFACAIVRLAFGRDGSMFAGLTNRGWTSRGDAAYGLQRLVWTGKVPFEVKEMRARGDGFELTFTKPVERGSAVDPASYAGSSYTFLYHETYGSPEIDVAPLRVKSATVSADGKAVRLVIDGLRRYYVHELHIDGVRAESGEALVHSVGYYTLNQVPK